MDSWPIMLSSLRLFFIVGISIGNCTSLWRAISHPKKPVSRRINQLVVTCLLIVNLVYLALVWVPFSIGSFNYSLKNHSVTANGILPANPEGEAVNKLGHQEPPLEKRLNHFTTTLEEIPIKYDKISLNVDTTGNPADRIFNRIPRQAKIESEVHEGTWAVVFPSVIQADGPSQVSSEVFNGKILPSFIDVDCGFQDTVTSSCCYCIAFVAIIKLILVSKPLSLSTSSFAQAGYTAILTGVPFLATLAIRYAEQVGRNFAPHTPVLSSDGYTVYNIICDIHISDSFVFLSFLEWAGLMMVLLLTVTSFIGVATKTGNSEGYSNELNDKTSYRTIDKLVFVGGKWTRDIVLGIGALWSWPLKPGTILAFYVIYGQHWTNFISWTSHLVIAVSVVFIPLVTFLTNHTFLDEEDIWSPVENREDTTPPEVSSFHSKLSGKSLPDVFSRIDLLNPTFDSKYSRQVDLKDSESNDSISDGEASKNADEIRNNLRLFNDNKSDFKLIITMPSNRDQNSDKKLILQHDELDSPTTSDV